MILTANIRGNNFEMTCNAKANKKIGKDLLFKIFLYQKFYILMMILLLELVHKNVNC